MTNQPTRTSARRRWTAVEKANVLRRYLRGQVSLHDLAEETGATPGQISQWCSQALGSLESVFDRPAPQGESQLKRTVAARDARIRELEAVARELSTAVLSLKEGNGAP
jgi:transposase-like protein